MFLALGLAGHVGKGFEWRLNELQRVLVSTADRSPMREDCHYVRNSTFDAQTSCEYFGESADVAIYGNSHGVELAYAVAEELRRSNRSLFHFTISGCAVGFRQDIEKYCSVFYEDRLRFLHDNQRVRNVILTFRAEHSGSETARSLVELANYLLENGKNVIVVLQAPTLEGDITPYLRQAFHSGKSNIRARSVANWRELNDHVYASLQDLNPGVKIFDLADHFCESDLCYAIRDSQAMYYDDDHISVSGARRVAADIVRLLE